MESMWKLRVQVDDSVLLRVPISPEATITDLTAEIVRRVCKRHGPKGMDIKTLKDEDGCELDADDLVEHTVENNAKLIAEFCHGAQVAVESVVDEVETEVVTTPEGSGYNAPADASAVPAELSATDDAVELLQRATSEDLGSPPAPPAMIAYHTIESCASSSAPAGVVKVDMEHGTLNDLKRSVCQAAGIAFEEKAEPKPDEMALEVDVDDGHAVGPGACLCRSAFARHGVAPQEGGLSFCGLFSRTLFSRDSL